MDPTFNRAKFLYYFRKNPINSVSITRIMRYDNHNLRNKEGDPYECKIIPTGRRVPGFFP